MVPIGHCRRPGRDRILCRSDCPPLSLVQAGEPHCFISAAFFGLFGCAIQAGGSAFQLFPLLVLRGGQAVAGFKPEQLSALALLFLKLNDQVGSVALVFFAVYCLLIGCLILGSIFLPRFLGALMVLAGLGWLTFLYAPLADQLSPYIELLGIVAEVCLMLWLLVMGVNAERWQEQAQRERSNEAQSGF
ncbi:MAG: hypothetical protein DME71_12985 [Verrucomicrobia bacterium]|nr:MAG: hypothetical protein DME71_12985 [Verrucomicrobiota bacterium]